MLYLHPIAIGIVFYSLFYYNLTFVLYIYTVKSVTIGWTRADGESFDEKKKKKKKEEGELRDECREIINARYTRCVTSYWEEKWFSKLLEITQWGRSVKLNVEINVRL